MTRLDSYDAPNISLPLKDVVAALVASGMSHVEAKQELASQLQDGTLRAYAASSMIVAASGLVSWDRPPATVFDEFDRREVPNKKLRKGGAIPVSLWQASSGWQNDSAGWRLDINAVCIKYNCGKRIQREQFWGVVIEGFSAEQSASLGAADQGGPAPLASNRGAKRSSAWDEWIAEIALYVAQNGATELSGPKLSEEIDERLHKRGLPGVGEKGIAPARAVVMLLRRCLNP